ncbi:MAG TPA: SIR2 family protein, partial [Myxococcota bacterium]|nr:SIR2 family protein [Myxococcota bacterium]
GIPSLFLQGDDGKMKPTRGDELAGRMAELVQGPRLVVLASCQSAGDGAEVDSSGRGTVQSTVAARLADAGVPAVVAMQGQISMASVEKMMPVFFSELLKDGQIDRALAVARGVVRGRPDHWMPALFLRLTGGKIWYNPGFDGGKGEQVWKRLLKPVREGKLLPILGTGLYDRHCGTSFAAARALARKHHFPLAPTDWDDLPRVTQFLSVKESRYNMIREAEDQLIQQTTLLHRHWLPAESTAPGQKLGRLLNQVADHQRSVDPDDPFKILAELPASVYVATTYDPTLSWALSAADRRPQAAVSRWRYRRSPAPPAPLPAEVAQKNPLVFHVFGAFGKEGDDTLVVSEDDYFDYLLASASAKLIPAEVESALVDNSLLLLGFRLTDWSFRVLFRLIMSLPGRDRLKQYCHVAVQVDPDLQHSTDLEGTKAYLAQYFGQEA